MQMCWDECCGQRGNLRWNSNIVHKTGQSRPTLVEIKWKIPRESPLQNPRVWMRNTV